MPSDSTQATPYIYPTYDGTKFRMVDMNASNGGVARGTGISSTSVYTTVFSYSGSGHLFSFLVGLEGNLIGADSFDIKLTIDGVDVFIASTVDIGTGNLYNLDVPGDELSMGFSNDGSVTRFHAPHGGLFYGTSVIVAVKKTSSTSNKQFRAGLVVMTKES